MKISAFIASWDKNTGVNIIEFYPRSIKSKFDLEQTTRQIFLAYHNFFSKEDEKGKIERAFFKLPLININRTARVFLDSFKNPNNEEKIQPFIVTFLFPDYISEEDLTKFDDIIYNIGIEYIELKNPLLKKHFDKITEQFLLEEKIKDADISIDRDYSLKEAGLDYAKGVDQFKKKNFKKAFVLLKSAFTQFQKENKLDLILQASFFLGSALSQLKKFNAAQEYFEILENLSNELKHQKYRETALFMEGLCAFKVGDYSVAMTKFSELESKKIKFLDKFRFYFIYGQVLTKLKQNDKAINFFLKALEIIKKLEITIINKEKQAKTLLELGNTSYIMVIDSLNKGSLEQDILNSKLLEIIDYYNESIKIWEELSNYENLIHIYQLIGNIYDIMDNLPRSIDSYRKSLYYTDLTNDLVSKFIIFNLIILALERLEMHENIVKEIDEMLSKVVSYAYMDLFTISGFHRQLGVSLFKIGRAKEAISELLIAKNIYDKFETPVEDVLTTLRNIIEIYESLKEDNYAQYYQDQHDQLKIKIQELQLEKKGKYGALGNLKEIWICTEDGLNLISYAPETKQNPDLFGGFISAFLYFCETLTSKELKSMDTGIDVFTIFKQENHPIFILGRSNKNIPENLVQESLKRIYDEFWNRYKEFLEDINKFDGYVGRFDEFLKWVENS